MSVKEAERLGVMRQMDKRSINLRQASEELGLCQRQVKRIRKRYLQQGDLGLMSLKKGLRNGNKTPDATREKALSLLRQYFPDFGPTLAQEKLKVCYGIDLSRETIRKWMIVESLWNFKVRRKIKIHQRRTRRSRFGEMLQCDGSHHDWFEGRGGKCCLLLFVDDATSRIVSALFLPTETTEGYLECLEKHLMNYGRPLSIYVDKHSVFRVNQEAVSYTHLTLPTNREV